VATPIDTRRIRPGRLWYGFAAGVVVLPFVFAVVALLLAGLAGERIDPKFDNVLLGNGKQLDVPLAADRTYALYVVEGTSARCVFGPGVTTKPPASDYVFSRDDGSWKQAFELTVAEDGLYQVTCDAQSFAIGQTPDDAWLPDSVTALVLAVTFLPCLGIPTGIAIAVVVAVRRSRHKQALTTGR